MYRYSFIILLNLAFFPSLSFATDCTPTADCAAMGYTQSASDCSGKNMVKCPKDSSKVFCPSSSGTSSSGTKITCNIGSLIYGDGNCYDFYDAPTNIKPVGVVFDTNNRLAIALSDINSSGSSSNCTDQAYAYSPCKMNLFSGDCDIPALDNCTNEDTLSSCGANGNYNTTQMLSASGCGTAIAAKAVRAFVPDGCSATFCQKGKWFIPSMRDWINIYDNRSKIRTPMNLLLNSQIHVVNLINGKYYWSATEYGNSPFTHWLVQMRGQATSTSPTTPRIIKSHRRKNGSTNVYLRPVVKY